MRSYKGKSVYKGIALGPVAVLANKEAQVKRCRIEDPEMEIARLEEAAEQAESCEFPPSPFLEKVPFFLWNFRWVV